MPTQQQTEENHTLSIWIARAIKLTRGRSGANLVQAPCRHNEKGSWLVVKARVPILPRHLALPHNRTMRAARVVLPIAFLRMIHTSACDWLPFLSEASHHLQRQASGTLYVMYQDAPDRMTETPRIKIVGCERLALPVACLALPAFTARSLQPLRTYLITTPQSSSKLARISGLINQQPATAPSDVL